jgi:hypothetical protein
MEKEWSILLTRGYGIDGTFPINAENLWLVG